MYYVFVLPVYSILKDIKSLYASNPSVIINPEMRYEVYHRADIVIVIRRELNHKIEGRHENFSTW